MPAWVTTQAETLLKRDNLRPSQQEALHRVLLHPKIGKDTTTWRAALDEFAARFPESRDLATLETNFARTLLRRDAVAGRAHLEQLATSKNEALARFAAKELDIAQKAKEAGPIQAWRLTAIDGREVDLGKMRGQVVIVYFWMTNSPGSKRELEALKSLHEKHGGKGLEILGVVLDTPRPTAEAATSKLKAYVEANALPWPVYTELAGMDTVYLRAAGVTHSGHATVLDKEGAVQPGCLTGDALVKKVEELLAK